jgi:CRISPR-associated protein Cst2
MAKKQSDTVSLPRRIFGVVVTRPAPSAGTGGETELNRGTLQKITGPTGAIHAKFTSPSLRNGLRETAIEAEFSVNRRRVKNAGQPTVTLTGPIDPKENLDDALLGSMVAEKGSGGAQTRDSMLLINEAISLSPYRRDTSYHQSPRFVSEDDSGRKTEASALIHKEVCFSAFQYPFALNAAQVREEGLEAHGRNLLDCLS